MKIGRIVLLGFVLTVFGIIVGNVFCGNLFSWVYQLEPTFVWRDMKDIDFMKFNAFFVLLNIILAFVYVIIHKSLPGSNKFVKGICFGLMVWLIGILPGMVSTNAFMVVADGVIVYWTIFEFFNNIIKGVIISLIYGE